MNPDWHDLIQRHIAGLTTDAEAAQLQDALQHDDPAARLYLRYMNLDVALEAQASSAEATRSLVMAADPPAGTRRGFTWWSWRPLTAAAAGLVLGLFSASLVYGFVTQRSLRTQSLLSEGFENAELPRDRGVPMRAGVWSGDLQAPQGAESDVQPAEGLRMVTLPPVEKRKFSYAFRFVDMTALPPMSAGQNRQIEVTAQFHGSAAGVRNRFQIRLAAFAEDIAGAREIWVRDHVDEQALLHVAKTAKGNPADRGWTTVRSMIDVPAGARVVLISLAAGVADSEVSKTAHYLDDVQVRLITREVLP